MPGINVISQSIIRLKPALLRTTFILKTTVAS